MKEFDWGISMNDDIDDYSISQIENIRRKSSLENANIVMMPDVHPGNYTPIGFTAIIDRDKLTSLQPSIIGNDIGCGVTSIDIELPKKRFSFEKLDNIIKEVCITSDRKYTEEYSDFGLINKFLNELHCKDHIDIGRALDTFGTLGGGNHFIEIEEDSNKGLHLTVHSGSRNLGAQVYKYYQDLASKLNPDVPYIDACLGEDQIDKYLSDIKAVSFIAIHSRFYMMSQILKESTMKYNITSFINKNHNCIVQNHNDDTIKIHKGSIDSSKMDRVIIPVNSRDGLIYGFSIPDSDWNYSLPHGAGRLLKRSEVSNHYTVSSFKKAMKDVYSSTISKDTLDECPMAYRDIEYLKDSLKDVLSIVDIWKPVYNFKNGSKE